MKRFLSVLLLIALFLPALCITASAAAPQVTYRIGETEISEPIAANKRIALPEAPTAQLGSRTFIGWAANGELYPAGYVYVHAPYTDITFEAVSVELQTMRGAAVSLTGATTLRFDGSVDRAGYERLLELVGADGVTCGMLVALYKQVYGGTRIFTHDADTVNVAPSLRDRVSASFTFSNETHRFFSGRTDAIANASILEKYAARAYLAVKMSNGVTHTFYATFDPDLHARTAHGVSAFAFEDRDLETPDGRYSAADMQTLRARLDRVVNVDQMAGTVCNKYSYNNIDFLEYCYYTSPYRVSEVREDYPTGGKETYVVVGKDGGDFQNITAYFMGGSYRQPSGDECNADGYYITVNSYTV